MARKVRNPKIDTPSARASLKRRREPYWTPLTKGKALGYRKGKKGGTWIARYRDDAGQQHYGSVGRVVAAHAADVAKGPPDADTGMKLLAGDLLGAGHDTLGAIDLDDERAALVPMARPGDDLTLPLGKLLQQALSLVLPELLDHDLLGGLGRDAAEALQRDVLAHTVVLVPPYLDLAGGPVDVTAELLGVERVEMLASGADHRLLEILHQPFPVAVPPACD